MKQTISNINQTHEVLNYPQTDIIIEAYPCNKYSTIADTQRHSYRGPPDVEVTLTTDYQTEYLSKI